MPDYPSIMTAIYIFAYIGVGASSVVLSTLVYLAGEWIAEKIANRNLLKGQRWTNL